MTRKEVDELCAVGEECHHDTFIDRTTYVQVPFIENPPQFTDEMGKVDEFIPLLKATFQRTKTGWRRLS